MSICLSIYTRAIAIHRVPIYLSTKSIHISALYIYVLVHLSSRCICCHLWAATTTLCHLYLVQLNRPSFHEINHRIVLDGSGESAGCIIPLVANDCFRFLFWKYHQFSASRRGDRQAETRRSSALRRGCHWFSHAARGRFDDGRLNVEDSKRNEQIEMKLWVDQVHVLQYSMFWYDFSKGHALNFPSDFI